MLLLDFFLLYKQELTFLSLLIFLLINKPTLLRLIAIICTLLASPFVLKISTIIENIGGDSLSEASNFNHDELLGYLSVFLDNVDHTPTLYIIIIMYITVITLIIHTANEILFKYISLKLAKIIMVALMLFLVIFSYKVYCLKQDCSFKESKVISNFSKINNLFKHKLSAKNNIDIIVYIGESTSRANMSLYGYFRNTTPYLDRLKNDGSINVFNNVFSTHTHTSPSLLEALSIPNEDTDDIKAIFNKKRISIIDILNMTNIKTYLYSNQSVNGSWDFASSIIFKNVTFQHYNKRGKTAGNWTSDAAKKMYDHLYLNSKIDEISTNKGVSFFHSYAGHLDYCYNIPVNARNKVDEQLDNLSDQSISSNIHVREKIECYDSAIKYIDKNLNTIISKLSKLDEPKALIYFSDHGDSPYTAKGHDSSQYQIEMSTVPLIVYLNDSAKKQLDINFSNVDKQLKLDYLPYLIAKILGMNIGNYQQDNIILVRDTLSGTEYLDLTKTNNKFWSVNQYANKKISKSKFSCSHRTNTIQGLVTNMISFDCLEFDAVIDNDNAYIGHDYPTDSEFELDLMLENTQRNHKAIWIDAKNINKESNCLTLSDHIRKDSRDILVEFPSASVDNLHNLSPCMNELRSKVKYLSYYVPTQTLLSCVNGNQEFCLKLESLLERIASSKQFNSFSFDYRGIDFMLKNKSKFNSMMFHAWGIRDLEDKRLESIEMGVVRPD